MTTTYESSLGPLAGYTPPPQDARRLLQTFSRTPEEMEETRHRLARERVINNGIDDQMTRTVLQEVENTIRRWRLLETPPKRWEPGTVKSVRMLVDEKGNDGLRMTRFEDGEMSMTWQRDAHDMDYWIDHKGHEEDHEGRHEETREEDDIPTGLGVSKETVLKVAREIIEGKLKTQAILTAREYHVKTDIGFLTWASHGKTWFKEIISRITEHNLCNPENIEELAAANHAAEREFCHCDESSGKPGRCDCDCRQCREVHPPYQYRNENANWPEGTWQDANGLDYPQWEDRYYWDDTDEETESDHQWRTNFGDPPPQPYWDGRSHRPALPVGEGRDQGAHGAPDGVEGTRPTRGRARANPRDLVNLAEAFNHAVRKYLMDEDTLKTLERLERGGSARRTGPRTDHTNIVPERYTALEKHKKAFDGLLKTAPGLAALHYRTQLMKKERKRPLNHAGQLVKELRTLTGLQRAAWEILCRVTDPAARDCQVKFNSIRQASMICRGLAEANRPKASLRLLKRAAMARWPTGNPGTVRRHELEQNNWRRMLNAYLDDGGGDRSERLLAYVADATMGSSQEGKVWGTGKWPVMAKRARKWHRQLHLQGTRHRGLQQQQWISELEQTRAGAYTILPVTNGALVTDLAERMENCLESFIMDMDTGYARLFLLTRKDEPPTAAMISWRDGEWYLSETETMTRTGATTDEARKAAIKLPQMYTEAERKNRREKTANRL